MKFRKLLATFLISAMASAAVTIQEQKDTSKPVTIIKPSGNKASLQTVGGLDASDNYVPLKVAADGSLVVSGGGGGGGGDASAANQVIGNTSLNNIDGKILQGTRSAATSQSVTLSTEDRTVLNNQLVQATKIGDVVVNDKLIIGGARDKWRDSFESLDATNWDFVSGLNANDYISLDGNVQGSSFLRLSLGYDSVKTVSQIKGLKTFKAPYRLGFGTSISQRINGEMQIARVCAVDGTGAPIQAVGENTDIFGADQSINKIVVASNVVYITFNQDHPYNYDDFIVISKASDTRVNAVVRITGKRGRRMVFGALTLASATYTVGANAVANKINFSRGGMDCAGVAYIDTTSANALYFTRGQGSPEYISAASSFGTTYTEALVPSAQPFAVNLLPRFNTEIVVTMDTVKFGAPPTDSTSPVNYFKRSQNIPDPEKSYAVFIETVALPNKGAPINILSAVKTGTTTATVTTASAHGLATGAYVKIYGQRSSSWSNVTAEAPITVTGANTFTVTWGTAVTETVYNGVVIPVNQTSSNSGFIQNVLGYTWTGGRLFVGLAATAAVNRGDTVRLYGVGDSNASGLASGLSGRFRVRDITPNIQETGIATGFGTTSGNGIITMADTSAVVVGAPVSGTGVGASSIVQSIVPNTSFTGSVNSTATASGLFDLAMVGVLLEPLDVAPQADTQPNTVFKVGAMFRETDFRFNFFRILDYTRTPVEITGGHSTGDGANSVPAYVSGSVSAVQSSGASISSSSGLGGWYTHPAIVGIADVASAAITATSTGSAISNTLGNAFQVLVDTSAVTGTTPTMDVDIEESYDGGTTFVKLYSFPRITAIGKYYSPVLRSNGRHIRYVRTVAGTTPSFTNAITRTVWPSTSVIGPVRQFIDRSIVLNTLNSTTPTYLVDGNKDFNFHVLCSAQTTAATVAVEFSMDGTAWHTTTNTLTSVVGVAHIKVTNEQWKFARLKVTSAGTGITLTEAVIRANN